MAIPHNLYIHVPFCASKCNYCAFYSTVCTPDWAGFAAGIIRDIEYWSDRLGRPVVPTIFFGGGTPSLMPAEIFAQIMAAARAGFDIAPDAEITMEANPGTLDSTRLQEFSGIGINRISVGIQSLDDKVLKFLGRGHSADDARELVRAAQNLGLRVSGDFIYGLPGQNLCDVQKMCSDILDMGLSHASVYELSVEPETPFAKQKIQVPSNEAMAEMYQAVGERLAGVLPRYEISNYAASGHECRHNQNIWAGEPYIGIGPAAAGRVLIGGQWWEIESSKSKERRAQVMDNKTRAVEKVITGLRTVRGVKLGDDARSVIDWDFVSQNPKYFRQVSGALCIANEYLILLDGLLPKIIA
jgi:oxygen-independent coproporphyrinogen-3 oxidase